MVGSGAHLGSGAHQPNARQLRAQQKRDAKHARAAKRKREAAVAAGGGEDGGDGGEGGGDGGEDGEDAGSSGSEGGAPPPARVKTRARLRVTACAGSSSQGTSSASKGQDMLMPIHYLLAKRICRGAAGRVS